MATAHAIDLMGNGPLPAGADAAKAPPATRRVLAEMDRVGLPFSLLLLPDAVRTNEHIAEFCGCDLTFIVVSAVLRGKTTKKPFLLLHSATTRLDDKMLGMMVGENLQRADDEFIRRLTGYPNGGVPPMAHLNRMQVMMDAALTLFPRVWCKAGDPAAIVSVPVLVLARSVSARIVRLEL